MDKDFVKLIEEAKKIAIKRNLSDYASCGHVGCALLTTKGNIYTGISVDSNCNLGKCAEYAAIAEMLKNKDFIRISNSCIINIKQVECFDTSIIGTILVKLRDNSQEKVSKRNVKEIMKLLRQRGKLK